MQSLFDALRSRDPNALVAALAAVDVNGVDRFGRSALYLAARDGDLAAVSILLAHGADPAKVIERDPDTADQESRHGGFLPTALHAAARFGHVEVVAALIAAGAPVEACSIGNGYRRPLHVAAVFGHAGVVRLLLEYGADRDAVAEHGVRDTRRGRSPHSYAVEYGHSEVASLLAPPDTPTPSCEELLRAIARNDMVGAVALLAAGCNPMCLGAGDRSPWLAVTVDAGRLEMARLFLAHGAVVTGQALQNAAWTGGRHMLGLLLTASSFDASLAKVKEATRQAHAQRWLDLMPALKELERGKGKARLTEA